ncbi:MAG: PilZ domain-containing protein [Candidatus Electrothrix sp. AU1_5]|nr:PilZ domain-containing protein [Candidatus Electrothrix gigas]
MDDKKERLQHRINVLRAKIFYTEQARNNYKDTHPALYQTNSYYLEGLQQQLQALETSCVDLENRDQRKFSRVSTQWPVRLYFRSSQYQGILDNLSLSGSFINGAFKQSKGDICKIDLKKSTLDTKVAACAISRIVRTSDNGIALEFVGMRTDSYNWLETELLTQAADPSVLEDEILQRSIFTFKDNLVYNNTFECNRDKLKKLLHIP